MTKDNPNTRRFAEFVVSMRRREIPPAVLDAARLCLADWLGVAMGAKDEAAARVVLETSRAWSSAGRSTVLLGASAAAPIAALANGTLAHCLDFDDTYVKGVTHISAPVWAATLAVGEEAGAGEDELLRAYVAGFEAAARAGYGLGELVTARGWHGTGVFGRIGAAASASVLLGLDERATVHALGAAATQASGLAASFGTMAKPFHAGKAAMDGVIAAQLARHGLVAAESVLDAGGGLDNALIQDKSATVRDADFSGWEILQNSFKPYAACHLTHPAIDAAKQIRAAHPAAAQARSFTADVWHLAKQVTGEKSGAPATPLEGKFDLKYCIALALHGHTLSAADFREPMRLDPAVAATAARIRVNAGERYGFASARLQADLDAGSPAVADIEVAKGHPGNPIGWEEMRDKYSGLVDFAPADAARHLFSRLQRFGERRQVDLLREAAALLARA
jgi:2-methylcitrate dehydratase PrpD